MEKIKKYFQFSGTINGTNYFLRNLLAYVIAFTGGFTLGWGMGMENNGIMAMGFLIYLIALWFSLTTIYKRFNALWTEKATLYTVLFVLLGVIVQATTQYEIWNGVLSFIAITIGLVLIFKNSHIEKHNG